MDLQDRVERAYVALVGNRLMPVFGSAFVFTLYKYAQSENVEALMWAIGSSIANAGMGSVAFGYATVTTYLRTKEHIKRHGSLEARFAQQVILGSENRSFAGYCQLQGMYLAAKKYGCVPIVREAKRKFSNNIIPNI